MNVQINKLQSRYSRYNGTNLGQNLPISEITSLGFVKAQINGKCSS
ncbi:hypothetical protein [Paenibacillus sp. LK1]|nr:hypothetical protein [Paenibacillus sp. LK1]